jgi:hypothetical protein
VRKNEECGVLFVGAIRGKFIMVSYQYHISHVVVRWINPNGKEKNVNEKASAAK